MDTLLLNADGSPISLLPLSCLTWQDALKFIWPNEAEVLHHYEDWAVRSPSLVVQVPAVMMLREQVKSQRIQMVTACPVPDLIFLRDNYTCQYCNKVFPARSLTLDHVLPRKYGGRSLWENLSSACEPCNGRRGHDIRIQPATQPFRPTYHQLVRNMRKRPLTIPHPSWNFYLGWPEENIQVVGPRKCEAA